MGNVLTDLRPSVTVGGMAMKPVATDLLWPDAETGPWLVTVWWRAQRGTVTPVGLDIRAWISKEGRAVWRASYHDALPRADADVEFGKIGSQLLRDLPVGRVIEEMREALLRASNITHGAVQVPHPALDDEAWRRVLGDLADLVPPPADIQPKRGGRDLGDAHYMEVARVYRAAVKAGEPPRMAVAAHFVVSPSNAAKKIARARGRGFLPATSRGSVGPLTEEL